MRKPDFIVNNFARTVADLAAPRLITSRGFRDFVEKAEAHQEIASSSRARIIKR